MLVYDCKTGAPHKCEPIDARELVAGGAYVRELPRAASASLETIEVPKGSSSFMGQTDFDLGPMKIPLGDLVAAAQARSGQTVAGWNALADTARKKAMLETVEVLKGQATADAARKNPQ